MAMAWLQASYDVMIPLLPGQGQAQLECGWWWCQYQKCIWQLCW
jgi:hypothetical protein